MLYIQADKKENTAGADTDEGGGGDTFVSVGTFHKNQKHIFSEINAFMHILV